LFPYTALFRARRRAPPSHADNRVAGKPRVLCGLFATRPASRYRCALHAIDARALARTVRAPVPEGSEPVVGASPGWRVATLRLRRFAQKKTGRPWGGRSVLAVASRLPPLPPEPSVIVFLEQFGVGIRVEHLVHLVGLLDLDHVQPTVAVGVLVDRLGLVGERRVDLDHRAADRGVHIRRRLHRFDHRTGRTGLDTVADVGKFHVDQVAEQLLGVVGNADGDLAVAFDAGPLMGLQELQIAGDLAHRLLRGYAGSGRPLGVVGRSLATRRA